MTHMRMRAPARTLESPVRRPCTFNDNVRVRERTSGERTPSRAYKRMTHISCARGGGGGGGGARLVCAS